jgi:hypothetical protein
MPTKAKQAGGNAGLQFMAPPSGEEDLGDLVETLGHGVQVTGCLA